MRRIFTSVPRKTGLLPLVIMLMLLVMLGQRPAQPLNADHGPTGSHDDQLSEHFDNPW